MRPEYLALLIPAGLAILLEKGPTPLREWWREKIEKDWKATVLLMLCLIVAFAAVIAACNDIDLGLGASCNDPRDPQLWVSTTGIGIAAWLVTQGAYALVTPKKDLTLNVERLNAPINVTAAANPPQPAIDLSTATGPGALSRGVQVDTLPNIAQPVGAIPLKMYSDIELRQLSVAVEKTLEERGKTALQDSA